MLSGYRWPSPWLLALTTATCSLDVEPLGEGKSCGPDGECLAGYTCNAAHLCVMAPPRLPDGGRADMAAPDEGGSGTGGAFVERDGEAIDSGGGGKAGDATAVEPPHLLDGGAATDSSGGGDAAQADRSATPDAAQADADCPEATVYYLDADGDGFGQEGTARPLCPPVGEKWVEQGGDCNDANTDVFPAQTAYFPVAYAVPGGDSFDYDCSGSEEPDPSSPGEAPDCSATLLLGLACAGTGFAPTARSDAGQNAICGSTELATCVSAVLTCVPNVGASAAKRCR